MVRPKRKRRSNTRDLRLALRDGLKQDLVQGSFYHAFWQAFEQFGKGIGFLDCGPSGIPIRGSGELACHLGHSFICNRELFACTLFASHRSFSRTGGQLPVKGTAEPLVHFLRIIRLRKLSGKYYDKGMKLTKKNEAGIDA